MRIPSCVAFRPVPAIMRLAINLDGQSPFETDEIQHDVTEGMLPAEFEQAGAFTEFSPDEHFRQISGSALSLCNFERGVARREAPSTTPIRGGGPSAGWWRGHILNTPKRAPSSTGAFNVAASANPNTSRVCAGSIIPSSHNRAVA